VVAAALRPGPDGQAAPSRTLGAGLAKLALDAVTVGQCDSEPVIHLSRGIETGLAWRS
jgi:hypothetical protein